MCLDKFRWEVENPTQAAEVAFKIPEARHCWLYVQRLLIKIILDNDFRNDKGLRSLMASALNDYVVQVKIH